ncbi:hypothetical protein BDF21DRAFT_396874 [Thamnidium elegans]|nr:hypothetical protein BDF21DRAFT_396874 [Thamnidium elegans]
MSAQSRVYLKLHNGRADEARRNNIFILMFLKKYYILEFCKRHSLRKVPRCNNGLSKQMQYFAALQHRNSYTSEISCFGLEDDPNNVNKARIKSHADNVTEPNNRQARYEQHHFVVRVKKTLTDVLVATLLLLKQKS